MLVSEYKISRELTKQEKRYGFLIIVVPFVITLYSIFSGALFHIRLFTLMLLVTCYCATVIGVTVGYHRLLTHRSFKANRIPKIILVCLGCMSYEGPPLFWVAVHRRHHKYTEQEADPHSPLINGKFSWRGVVHAHMSWMINHQLEDWNFYVRDLIKDKDIRIINRYYNIIALSGLLIPGIINGLFYLSWYHFFEGVIVCGFVRVFLQQHVTWAINSVCHVWGKQDFAGNDNSRNNWLFAILALGEGWHNGHHAFPFSAKHGLKKGQIDFSFMVIKALARLKMVSKIREPTSEQINEKLIKRST
ncbi:acyl-CoA desaturase [Legionella saoudiensis]|uniref:acyl-CoA desaturase n=1 Tax=Legionella saoudiensis TaxID=1750561 RepID=UPI00072FDCB6|nr:fatty acid desaturase [Legionella saoudiensis]